MTFGRTKESVCRRQDRQRQAARSTAALISPRPHCICPWWRSLPLHFARRPARTPSSYLPRSIIIDSPGISQHWLPRTPMTFNKASIPWFQPLPRSWLGPFMRIFARSSCSFSKESIGTSLRLRLDSEGVLGSLDRRDTFESPTHVKNLESPPCKNTT